MRQIWGKQISSSFHSVKQQHTRAPPPLFDRDAVSSVPCCCFTHTFCLCTRILCQKKQAKKTKKLLLLLPQCTMKSQQTGDVGRGDSTHAQTRSVSDTNVAAALLAVRSDLCCSLGNPPLLLLQGLLQVQEAVSNIPAFTVWPEMAQWDCWGRLQWRTEGREKRLSERSAKECKVKGPVCNFWLY